MYNIYLHDGNTGSCLQTSKLWSYALLSWPVIPCAWASIALGFWDSAFSLAASCLCWPYIHKNMMTAGAVRAPPIKKNAPGTVSIVLAYRALYIGP